MASSRSRSTTGAGASPRFPPQCDDAEQARERLSRKLSVSPMACGYDRARWTLELLLEEESWLELSTVGGMHQLLRRLGFRWGRGRTFMRSPDTRFDEKKAYIARLLERVEDDEAVQAFYLDEVSYYARPRSAGSWSLKARQPTVDKAPGSKWSPSRQVLGAFHTESGRLFYTHRKGIGRHVLLDLYRELVAAYPKTERIVVIQDNLPVHFHHEVLAQLERQRWPFPICHPSTWPDPHPAAERQGPLPVQLVGLPTYASWLNPIERLWRWLKRKIIAFHPLARDWEALQSRVEQALDAHTGGPSPELLQHVSMTGG